MHLQSLTYDELVKRGIEPRFAAILVDPAGYHPDLRFNVGKVDWDYTVPEGVSEVVPLWDVNADSYVRWVRNGETEYVWLFHDDPNWVLVARSEQGILARLWYGWAEFQESDEECQNFADAIGFRFCRRALEVWRSDYDALDQWILELRDDTEPA